MVIKRWERGNFSIIYKKPKITPYINNLLKSMGDVMYFYYDIEVLSGNKTVFMSRTHDFPKVQILDSYIDSMLNLKEEDMFLYENYESNGFHRKTYYTFKAIEDDFDAEMEYFYKIEKTITHVKQRNESKYNRYEEYMLTIGQSEAIRKGYDDGGNFGQSIYIKHLSKDDLISIKNTARRFCEDAIEEYNNYLTEYKIKCPECAKRQLYLDALLPVSYKDTDCLQFKCVMCGYLFNDEDDYNCAN